MEELTEKNYDQTIKKGLHLVDFWAPWCGPCKMQTPILEELEKEYTEAELQISKVNIDEYPEIARRYGIQSIPTMLILRDGQLVKQIVGVHVQPQLKKELSILDLSQYLGHILVETAKTFSLFLNLQTPVELSNESNYGFDYDYKILQCS